jgi:AraC family transcriptional regulator, transcriptional activator of pobA
MDEVGGGVNNPNMRKPPSQSPMQSPPHTLSQSPQTPSQQPARSHPHLNSQTHAAAANGMPAYALYGEAQAGAAFDLLHVESIAERSRLHGWEIRPHRHELLCQLLLVRRGSVQAQLDGQHVALRGPAVITVPALAAHGFRFSSDTDGDVFTLLESHLRTLSQRDAALADSLLQLRAILLPARSAATTALLAAARGLRDELSGCSAWRLPAVDAALLRLVVAVLRAWPAHTGSAAMPAAETPARALAHVQGLRRLVDAQFRQQPGMQALAAQLRITPTQLNRVCRQVLGHPALAVLHARLLLEAQRELAYSSLSVQDIALGLGFCEPGYFARFFRRCCGQSPSAWRAAQHTAR